jgi:hypothetical protein
MSDAPELQIIVVRPDDSIHAAVDGGPVPIISPPQGGRVIFAGARATNVDGCGLQLTGALRDESSHQVRVDSRTIDLTATGDGWGASAVGTATGGISNFSNIAVCPNEWATTDVYGHAYELEVTIQDHSGRSASQTLVVTPYCSEPSNAAYCMCICAAHYTLGQACGP